MEYHRGAPGYEIGRQDTIARILAALKDPDAHGALVVGEPGIGKTAVARRVMSTLGSSVRILRVTGSSTLRDIPFAVLAPFLKDLPTGSDVSPLAVYRTVLDHLGARISPSPMDPVPLIIIDDAHVLDEASSELLTQLAVSNAAKLLVLSRVVPEPPLAFVSLWHEELLHRYDLECLTLEDIHELCVLELGGEVTPVVSTMLFQASGGSPMFFFHLLDQGRHLGHIVKNNGVWLLIGDSPRPGMLLADLVRGQLSRRSEPELAALELIALAEPIAEDTLFSLVDTAAVDSLQTDGLIRTSQGRDNLVEIGHPVYGEVLRSGMPSGRSLALRSRVLELTGTDLSSIDQVLRHVAWGLDCGASMADDLLVRAASLANRLYQPDFALRAVAEVSGDGHRERALIQQARALVMRNNLGFARELADEVLARTNDLSVAKSAVVLGADIRLRSNEPPESIGQLADTWEAILARNVGTGTDDGELGRAARRGIRLLHAYQRNLEGRFSEAAQELQEIAADPAGSDDLRIMVLTLLGEALRWSGSVVQGVEAGRQALALLSARGDKYVDLRDFVVGRYSLSLVFAGYWKELTELLDAHLRPVTRGLIYFGGTASLLTGLAHLKQGHAKSALQDLRLAIEALRQSDIAQLLPMAIGLAAYSAFLCGNAGTALKYVREFDAVSVGKEASDIAFVEAHVAAARSLEHGSETSIRELHRISDTASRDNMPVFAAAAMELAFQLGDDTGLASLASLTAGLEGRDAAAVNAVAAAFLKQEPRSLVAAGEQVEQDGYVLLAAESFAEAAMLLEKRGEMQKCRAIRQRISAMESCLDGARSIRLVSPERSVDLTRRERDIVELARQGNSNRDIADRLTVSVRTVEGHLYRIFGKLGITRREDL